jgi:hypothetical protein
MHVLILVLLAIAACSSAPAKAVQASTCREQGKAIVSTAATCPAAVAALERLVERSPECAAILSDDGGAGVRCKDGGENASDH